MLRNQSKLIQVPILFETFHSRYTLISQKASFVIALKISQKKLCRRAH